MLTMMMCVCIVIQCVVNKNKKLRISIFVLSTLLFKHEEIICVKFSSILFYMMSLDMIRRL